VPDRYGPLLLACQNVHVLYVMYIKWV
jgi:hypothetical protein